MATDIRVDQINGEHGILGRIEAIIRDDETKAVRENEMEGFDKSLRLTLKEMFGKGSVLLTYADNNAYEAALKDAGALAITELKKTTGASADPKVRQKAAVQVAIENLIDEAEKQDGVALDTATKAALNGTFNAKFVAGDIKPSKMKADQLAEAIADKLNKQFELITDPDLKTPAIMDAVDSYRDNLKGYLEQIFKHDKGTVTFNPSPEQLNEIAAAALGEIQTNEENKRGLTLQRDALRETVNKVFDSKPLLDGKSEFLSTQIKADSRKCAERSVKAPEGKVLETKNEIIAAVMQELEYLELGEVNNKSKQQVLSEQARRDIKAALESSLDGSLDYKLPENKLMELRNVVDKSIVNYDIRDKATYKLDKKIEKGAIATKFVLENSDLSDRDYDDGKETALKSIENKLKFSKEAKDKFGKELGDPGEKGDDARKKLASAFDGLDTNGKGRDMGSKSAGDKAKGSMMVFKNPIVALVAVVGGLWLGIKKLFGAKTKTDEQGQTVEASKGIGDYALGIAGLAVAGAAGYGYWTNREAANKGGADKGRGK